MFWVLVKLFLMDQHEVTVGQFRQFVQATGYRTQAEKFGTAGVLDEQVKEWRLVAGASWRYPYGPAANNQPVTQVSWNDATAYTKWAGKRCPTSWSGSTPPATAAPLPLRRQPAGRRQVLGQHLKRYLSHL